MAAAAEGSGRGVGAARSDAADPVAVVDIGSNSGRVMVYVHEAGGQLRILAGSRASLRLARGLDATGRIPADALERTFEALRDFRSIARGSGARRIVAAGTSALRDAGNGPAFIRRVRRELGFEIRVLSGVEEARYGFLGAVGGLPVDDGALFDLGGGSLQVGYFRARRLLGAVSLPLGGLRVSDTFLKSDPPSSRELRRLREHVRATLEEAGIRPLAAGEQVVGTGGTIRNLARVDERSAGYPIHRLHGYVLASRRLHEIATTLAGLRAKKRGRVPGLNADRGDSVAGGAIVLDSLLQLLGADEVVVSGQGVREGLAFSLAHETLDPTPAVRRRAVHALAARFGGWSRDRAERRSATALALFAALERRPSPEVAEVLAHAAYLLDTGRTIDFFDRHEHAADLVLATDLAGFSHRQVALVSAIVRRAGDEDAPTRSLAPLVTSTDQPLVARSAVLLALADEITERCPPASDPALSCRVRADEAVVSVSALASWCVRALGERFEAAFGQRLRVVPGFVVPNRPA
jgi:exopolyphosphatase/guanosine-5'-triphosphate,3'-diphosphate pyrophosphatase